MCVLSETQTRDARSVGRGNIINIRQDSRGMTWDRQKMRDKGEDAVLLQSYIEIIAET